MDFRSFSGKRCEIDVFAHLEGDELSVDLHAVGSRFRRGFFQESLSDFRYLWKRAFATLHIGRSGLLVDNFNTPHRSKVSELVYYRFLSGNGLYPFCDDPYLEVIESLRVSGDRMDFESSEYSRTEEQAVYLVLAEIVLLVFGSFYLGIGRPDERTKFEMGRISIFPDALAKKITFFRKWLNLSRDTYFAHCGVFSFIARHDFIVQFSIEVEKVSAARNDSLEKAGEFGLAHDGRIECQPVVTDKNSVRIRKDSAHDGFYFWVRIRIWQCSLLLRFLERILLKI